MVDYRILLIVALYNNIKELAESVLGGFAVPVDFILAAVGWWKKDTWWGQGLLYGAVASIGREYMSGILARVVPRRVEARAAPTPRATTWY